MSECDEHNGAGFVAISRISTIQDDFEGEAPFDMVYTETISLIETTFE